MICLEGSRYSNCPSEMWIGDIIFRVMLRDIGFGDIEQGRVKLAIERGALAGYWSHKEQMYWLQPDSVNLYIRTALRISRWERDKKEGA